MTSMSVSLVQHVGSDEMIANAARVSTNTDNQGKSIEGLIKYLAKNHHLSPFEHNSITFMITAPLFVRDQWVRHRTQSYNVLSFRYTKLESDSILDLFYIPDQERPLVNSGSHAHPEFSTLPSIHLYNELVENLINSYENSYDTYLYLINQGVAEEVARSVLPSATMTRFYATANLRNWSQFCKERLAENAQWEIQKLAKQVDNYLESLFPIAWPALKQN